LPTGRQELSNLKFLVVIGEYTTETKKTVFIKKAEEYNLKFILLQI
jgi:hypothetical protein